MTRKARLNPYRAKIHYTYSVAEVAKLYDVHRNTVRAWLKSGLGSFRYGRQQFIKGAELRAFHIRTNSERRVTTPPGKIYCLGCRVPQPPDGGLVDVIGVRKGTINVRGICPGCGSFVHRHVSIARIEASGFAGQLRAAGLVPKQ